MVPPYVPLLFLVVLAPTHICQDPDLLDDPTEEDLPVTYNFAELIDDARRLTVEEVKGYKKYKDVFEVTSSDKRRKRETFPATFDARVRWPNCPSIKTIWGQGQCHSCWAVTAASLISDRLCIANDQRLNVFISPQQIAGCLYPNQTPQQNCKSGGHTAAGIAMVANNGVATGGKYRSKIGCVPYDVSFLSLIKTGISCVERCTNTSLTMDRETYSIYSAYIQQYEFTDADLKGPVMLNAITWMKNQIMTHGPIGSYLVTGFDFLLWNFKKDGVFNKPSARNPPYNADHPNGHNVRILGWTEDAWIIANAWSKHWGDRGIGYIKMGENMLGIESELTLAVVHKPAPAINLCKFSVSCGTAIPIQQAIPTDPKDPRNFYFFQDTCVQRFYFNEATLQLIPVGTSLPIKWVFYNSPNGIINGYKWIPEANGVYRLWLYTADGDAKSCGRVAENKFVCDMAVVPGELEARDLVGPRAIYYDNENRFRSWSYFALAPTELRDQTPAHAPTDIGDLFTRNFQTVTALLHLSATKMAVFGVLKGGTTGSSGILSYPSRENGFSWAVAPEAGRNILVCPP